MNRSKYFIHLATFVDNSRRCLFALALFCMMLFSPAAFGQTIIFQEDFESGQGNWYADNGVWEIGKPTTGPDSTHSPQNCAGTILSGNYPPNANTRLVSPQIDLRSVTISEGERIRLYFWHWFALDEESTSGPDQGRLQISANNGTWEPATGLAGPFSGIGAAWTQVYVDLTAYVGYQVRLGFYFTSTSRDQAPGWYIDDILIIKHLNNFTLVDRTESFESGIGEWCADNGVWEAGPPTVGPANVYDGQNCAATFLSGNYPRRANTRLISPEFDLPNLIAPEKLHLHFWHWFVLDEESTSGVDQGSVEISANNGPWQSVPVPFSGESQAWTHVCLDLSQYARMRIRIAFNLTSTSRDEANGWYVDNISIHKFPNVFNITNNPEGFEQNIGEWWVDNGVWEVGHPTTCPMNGRNSTNCAGTILDGNYPALANTRLISPEFTLGSTSGQSQALYFWHWYRMNETSTSGPDQGYVQISVHRGPWQNIAGPFSGISEAWTQVFVDLSAYAGSTMRIAFYFVSTSRDNDCGWYVDDIRFAAQLVDVQNEWQENRMIRSLTLHQNFPNPFNPETVILYELPQTSQVEVAIFNLLGERIRTLVDQRQAAGQHRLHWDGRNEFGMSVPSGVYLYRLRASEFVQTRKMILMQ